jgi:hypothetical protein
LTFGRAKPEDRGIFVIRSRIWLDRETLLILVQLLQAIDPKHLA